MNRTTIGLTKCVAVAVAEDALWVVRLFADRARTRTLHALTVRAGRLVRPTAQSVASAGSYRRGAADIMGNAVVPKQTCCGAHFRCIVYHAFKTYINK